MTDIDSQGSPPRESAISACRSCGGVVLRGVCVACGFCVVCCHCRGVRQADGAFVSMDHDPGAASHTICRSCFPLVYPEMGSSVIDRVFASSGGTSRVGAPVAL
jgi:hypothetical protein